MNDEENFYDKEPYEERIRGFFLAYHQVVAYQRWLLFCLADLEHNKAAMVSRITKRSGKILELIQHQQINIGTRLMVKKSFAFDNSLEVKIGKRAAIQISNQLAKNIFVSHETHA